MNILLQNCRIPYAQVAKQLKTSTDRIIYRVNRLQKEGYIIGFNTKLNYRLLGFDTHTLYIKLKHLDQRTKEDAIRFLTRFPFISWVGTCVGEYDIRTDLISKDISDKKKLIEDIYEGLENNIQSIVILDRIEKTVSDNYATFNYFSSEHEHKRIENIWPHHKNHKRRDIKDLDKTDWTIIRFLAGNAKAQYKEIGEHIGVTGEDARYRLDKILGTDVITRFQISVNFEKDVTWSKLLIRLQNKKALKPITNLLVSHKQTTDVIEHSGAYDIDATFYAKSTEDMERYITDLRTHFSDDIDDFELIIMKDSLKFPKVAMGIFDGFLQKRPIKLKRQ